MMSTSPSTTTTAVVSRLYSMMTVVIFVVVVLVVSLPLVDCASSPIRSMKVTSAVPSTKESDTSSIDILRGGSSSSSSDDPNYQNAVYTHPQQQQQQQQKNLSNDDDKKTSAVDEDEQLFHETVQDRVDRWRQEQMRYQPYGGGGGGGATTTAMPYGQQQTPYYQQQQTGGFNNNDNSIVNVNPQHQQQFPTATGSNNSPAQQGAVDVNRLKLILSVSKGSRAVTFFVLMWRNIYMFDVADTSIKKSMGFYRGFVRSILTLLLCGNIAGFVSSMLPSSSTTTTSTSSTDHHHHSTKTKKRMKAILNLDKLVEIVLLVWYFFRLTIFPSKYVPKEVFIAGALHSTFFLLQCQATTRFVWDEGIQLSPKAGQQQQQQQQQQQSDIFFDDDDDDMDDYQRYASYGGSQSAAPYNTQSSQ